MRKITMFSMVLLTLIGLATLVSSADSGTYGSGNNEVTITIKVRPIAGDVVVTYEHGGESSGPHPSTQSTGGGANAQDAPIGRFSDGRRYRIRNGEVQWGLEGSDRWAPLQKTSNIFRGAEVVVVE